LPHGGRAGSPEAPGRDITVRHEDVLETCRSSKLCRIKREFDEYRRLGVRIGNARTAHLPRRRNDLVGTRRLPCKRAVAVAGQLGDIRVLAVFAAKITARRRDGKRQASRKEMEQRLLFDGIDVLRNNLVIDEADQHAVPVLPDRADAELTGGDEAAVGAKAALHLALLPGFLEQRTFHDRSIGAGLKTGDRQGFCLGFTTVPAWDRCSSLRLCVMASDWILVLQLSQIISAEGCPHVTHRFSAPRACAWA
jgi:hypothetical protein